MDENDRRITFRENVRYRVDNGLSRGAPVLLLWLSLAMLTLVLVVALVMWVGNFGPNDQEQSFAEDLWMTLTRSVDAGTFGADEGTRFRMATLVITVVGLFAVALLIAVVTNSVQQRLDLLRRGGSVVAETDHTLILGNSTTLPIVVREIIEARPKGERHVIVILSQQDKLELEETLNRAIKDLRSAKVVVRRGEPSSIADLALVRPEAARSIIILRPEDDAGDEQVVRAAVAVVNKMAKPDTTVIAELHDTDTAAALERALRRKISPVLPIDVVPRIVAQTLRASGLGQVYVDLLNFEGDEFYLVNVPDHLAGTLFGAVLQSTHPATIVGISRGRTSRLCPDFSTEIEATDRLIILAKDLTTAERVAMSTEPISIWSVADAVANPELARSPTESFLFVGWNEMSGPIADEVGAHLADGSLLHVLVNASNTTGETLPPSDGDTYGGLKVVLHHGSSTDAETIGSILATTAPDHILVLSADAMQSPVKSDARTLLTLLHIDDALDGPGPVNRSTTNVVAEILLTDSVDLARFANPDDFIVSERLVSLVMTQLSEYRKRRWVFDDLFRLQNCLIEMQSPDDYGGPGEWTYQQLIEQGRRLGVVVIGWRKLNVVPDGQHNFNEPCMNPPKDTRVHLSDDDRVIAIVRAANAPGGFESDTT
jgi:hypothetical protein